jgi:hypothetical protein
MQVRYRTEDCEQSRILGKLIDECSLWYVELLNHLNVHHQFDVVAHHNAPGFGHPIPA